MEHPEHIHTGTSLPFRSHTALLLATALPFLQPSYRHPVELVTKFLEFSETIKLYQEFHSGSGNPFSGLSKELSSSPNEGGLFGLINTFIQDLEGLLCSLSSVCTGNEKEIITMFLNIIRAKNFYETYGDLLNLGSLFSQETPLTQPEDTPPVQTETAESSMSVSPAFPFGDLSSMLSSEQQETLTLLKNLFSNEQM